MKTSACKWFCGALVLSLAWSVQARASDNEAESGPIKVADVLDTDIRLGDGAARGGVNLDYPNATFLRIHMAAEGLPSDGEIVLTDGQKQVQTIPASDVISEGAGGYYAMSMDSDHVNLQVTDADGRLLEHGYTLRVDKIDVGFRDIAKKPELETLAVIGADQRQPAVCYQESAPVAYHHSQAVARIYGHGYVGTGWRVGSQNRMLTNHHVIGNAQNPADFEVWFGYEHVNCGNNGSVQSGVKVRGGTRLVGDSGLDFQLFTLNESQFGSVGRFGYLSLDVGALTQGRVIYIPQHGGGSPRQLALFVDGGGRCRIDATPGTWAQYTCDTAGGSSGSPVIDWNTNKAVALHNSATAAANQGHRINQIWPYIQPYFANGSVP
jgi:V8-like Glu-specific endopeptidase